MNASQLKNYLTPKNALVGLVVVIGAIILLITFAGQKESPARKEAPLTGECRPVPGNGKQTYDIKTDKPKSLQITQVVVDPIDVKEGKTQTITVKVKDGGNNTITKESGITATIFTDNTNTAVKEFVLRLAKDTEDHSALLTTWEGSWIRDDSYCNTYMETITATNDKGDETKVDLSFK